MSVKEKAVLLRAFTIECNDLLQNSSNISSLIKDKIENSLSKDRMMQLSEIDSQSEVDVISDCKTLDNEKSIFCPMFRLKPNGESIMIKTKVFDNKTFGSQDLTKQIANSAASVKDNYWICLSGNSLVTACYPRNQSAKRIETYINWLLNISKFKLTPKIKASQDIQLNELRSIKFCDPFGTTTENSIKNKSIALTDNLKDWIKKLFVDSKSLDDIDLETIISAELKLKFKKIKDEEIQKKLGAILKPVADAEDVIFYDKNGNPKTGRDLKEEKTIKIETTDNGEISENALNQEMARYLEELNK